MASVALLFVDDVKLFNIFLSFLLLSVGIEISCFILEACLLFSGVSVSLTVFCHLQISLKFIFV